MVNLHQNFFVRVALQCLLQEARQIYILISLQDVAFIWIHALLQQEWETMRFGGPVCRDPNKFPQDFVRNEPTSVACLLENLIRHTFVKLSTSLYILYEFVICIQNSKPIFHEHPNQPGCRLLSEDRTTKHPILFFWPVSQGKRIEHHLCDLFKVLFPVSLQNLVAEKWANTFVAAEEVETLDSVGIRVEIGNLAEQGFQQQGFPLCVLLQGLDYHFEHLVRWGGFEKTAGLLDSKQLFNTWKLHMQICVFLSLWVVD